MPYLSLLHCTCNCKIKPERRPKHRAGRPGFHLFFADTACVFRPSSLDMNDNRGGFDVPVREARGKHKCIRTVRGLTRNHPGIGSYSNRSYLHPLQALTLAPGATSVLPHRRPADLSPPARQRTLLPRTCPLSAAAPHLPSVANYTSADSPPSVPYA